MTKAEREALRRHDEEMRKPVSTLFPKPPGYSRVITCKGCGRDFTWTPVSGPPREYCTSACKTTNGTSQPRRHSP